MLVNIIYFRPKTPMIVSLQTVRNDSTFGSPLFHPTKLRPSRVVNTSEVGAPAVLMHTVVTQTRVVNTSQFGASALVFGQHYVRPARVVNTSAINDKSFLITGKLTQSRVVNESQLHGIDAIVISKHYVSPSRVQNTSVVKSPTIESSSPPSAWVPGEGDAVLVNDIDGQTTLAGTALRNGT